MKINKILSFALGILVFGSFGTSKLFAAAKAPEDRGIRYELVEETPHAKGADSKGAASTKKASGAYTGRASTKKINVKYGDTLWSIARANRPYKTTTKQTMLATLDLNPKAFFMGNVNGLLKNTSLRLPSYNQAHKRTPGRADVEVARQNQAWANYQAKYGKGNKSSGKFASPAKSYAGKDLFKSSFDKNTTVASQLAAAKKKEAALQNQIAKMEKIIKQKDSTIRRMKAKSGDTSASSALFKGVEKYTPLSGEAMKSNWPWFVAGGFLLFMLFLILRWKRKNVYAGKGGAGGMSRAQRKQAKQKQKQAAKDAKLAEKEAKKQAQEAQKQAKLEAKKAAKDARLQKKQASKVAKSAEPKNFDAAKAKAMQELEKDFNLPPSQDLAIDAVVDTKVTKKKSAPVSATKVEDTWEEDTFAELDDLELDFNFDDELDLDSSKKPDAHEVKATQEATSATYGEQKEEVVIADVDSQELELDSLDLPENFLIDDKDLEPLDDFELLADEDLAKIISETEAEFATKASGALADDEYIAADMEASFTELSDLSDDELEFKNLTETTSIENLDFSELETADTDFENLSTDEDFLSESEATKLEQEFLQEASQAKTLDADLELLDKTKGLSASDNLEIGEKEDDTSTSDKMPFFEIKDFNDLLHGVIANPEFAQANDEIKNLFKKEKSLNSNEELADAFAALEAMGGYDALGDIYDYTYSMQMRDSVLDEEQLLAWRSLRDEERQEEKQTNKVDGLTLNSQKLDFEKFYDTPQLHRLEELLQTKEIKEFEDYFSTDDEFDNMVENVKEDYLLDLTDFSEVPEFKELEVLDFEALDEAIDLAEEQVADKEELENILKDADQLEYENFFTSADDLEFQIQEPKFKETAEDTFLADLSDFGELDEKFFTEIETEKTQIADKKNSANLEELHKNFSDTSSDLEENSDAEIDLDLDFGSLNKLVEKDIELSSKDDLDAKLLAEVTDFAKNAKTENSDDLLDFVDTFAKDTTSSLNFDTKLNLAAAYIAIGDFSEAGEILKLVAQKGNSEQQAKALELGERENLNL